MCGCLVPSKNKPSKLGAIADKFRSPEPQSTTDVASASPAEHKATRWRGPAAWPMWSIGVGLILSGLRGSCFFLLLFSRRQPLPWEKFDDAGGDGLVAKNSMLKGFFGKLMIFDRK